MVHTFKSTDVQTMFRGLSQNSLKGRARFLVPFGPVLVAKLGAACMVYVLATWGGRPFYPFWAGEWGIQRPDWRLLFHCWDSAWYMRIASTGYSYPAYAFMPAYPFVIRIANLLTGEWLASSFLVSFLLGIAAVPAFQLLAEHYMGKSQALSATFLFFFFPPVFFTTSIAYSESLFLVAVIGSWLFCLRRKWIFSAAFAVIATLSRVYGLLIVLPLLLRLLGERRGRVAFLVVLVSAFALLGWGYYLFSLTGDWMVVWSAQNHWREGWPFGINSVVRSAVESAVSGGGLMSISPLRLLVLLLWSVVIAFVGIPIVASIDVDRDFGLYGALLFLFIVSFGNIWSFGRLASFIIPAWLTVRANRRFVVVIVVVTFLVSSVPVWYLLVVLGVGH